MLHHLVRRADGERLAAERTVRRAHRGEQHAQIVGDVRHGADRRPGIGADSLLIDGHNRRQAVDEIDGRLFELSDKAFRESRHRREQTPLALGIERVESQRRLAGPADTRDDDKLVARNLDGDVAQVVFAGTANFDGRSHCSVGEVIRPSPSASEGKAELPRWRSGSDYFETSRKYAGSSTCPWLRLVSLNGADTFSSSPLRSSHSQADSRCQGCNCENAKWSPISDNGTTRFCFLR